VFAYDFSFGILNSKGKLKPSSMIVKNAKIIMKIVASPIALPHIAKQTSKASTMMNQIAHLVIDLPNLNGSALSAS
jgi:hypothetical protein